ncbi:MAG TPA: SLC13 family permease [Anaerolineales bacterium]|nr:SLC13 family permease [Anaerolineales bacterium]
MLITLVLAATSLPIGEVMLGGALAMVLLNVLTMDQAYQAIDWKTVFLVAGMLPLGIAMTKTGAAANLAEDIIRLLGPTSPLALLAGLFLLAMLLTQVMNGAAVAAVVAPIAINIALRVGIEPRSLAMGIALATSMAFITPLGHPVNILVMGTGGYHFGDYLKAGLPMAVLLLIVILLLLPVIWPLA